MVADDAKQQGYVMPVSPSMLPILCRSAVACGVDTLSQRTEYAATDWASLSLQALGSLLYHVPRMSLDRWRTIAVEHELGVVITTPEGRRVLLTGRLDWYAQHESGDYCLIDHKSSAAEGLGPHFVEQRAERQVRRRAQRDQPLTVSIGVICVTP